MKARVVIGKYRSRGNARKAIWELGQKGFCRVCFYQIGKTPVEGPDIMNNARSGSLPLFARGVVGSDIAVEGRSAANLYDQEIAKEIMGPYTAEPPAFAVVVETTNSSQPHFAEDILKKYGADAKAHEFDVEEKEKK